ncbi:hypothetical protein [Mucilaginibacter pedocola]|uniref:Uncharacterized protein n=1 Tax=Mucilaginibacter pedocola TaxID=1792845 RepID=A0A1S9PKE6_9SPHI|nr:hypothetical protein [Mucilaginibacter pedocola]OOQ61389.1 hypothetical protein BC343_20670 [Mucilaginibacter pedocola]
MSEKHTGLSPLSKGMVTKTQLNALSKNFFSKLQVLDNGRHRSIDCSDSRHPEKGDTRAVIFNRKDVEALFAANPGCDGLKVYFGLHDKEIFPLPDDNSTDYQNKLMVVLITTSGQVENINDDASIAGKGLDNGKLCPPNIGC